MFQDEMFDSLKISQDEVHDSSKMFQDEIYEPSEDGKVARSM